MNEPLLRVEKLSKNFDRLPILKDVSFSLAKGEVIGLVGRQGAGKSALFDLLNGATPPSSGAIYLNGKRRKFSSRIQAQKIGIETVYQTSGLVNRFDFSANLFMNIDWGFGAARQTSGLVEQFTVTDNILLGREIEKFPGLGIIDKEGMDIAARKLLKEFNLFEMLNISQVMTHKPRVVKKSDSIKSVAEQFANSEFHALPVVNDKDPSKMEGIVTTTDVIRYMLKNL